MMTELRVKPVAAGAAVVAVLNKNGLAEAAGFPKAKPKPVEAVVVAAGAPKVRPVVGAAVPMRNESKKYIINNLHTHTHTHSTNGYNGLSMYLAQVC